MLISDGTHRNQPAIQRAKPEKHNVSEAIYPVYLNRVASCLPDVNQALWLCLGTTATGAELTLDG